MSVKDEYEELRKKQSLPPLEQLESMGLELEEGKVKVRVLARGVKAAYGMASDLLEGVVEPDTSITSLTEAGAFTNDEKKDVFELFKQLMIAQREYDEISLQYDDEKGANYIIDRVKEWREIVPRIQQAVTRMKESWQKKTDETVQEMYFG